MPEAIEKKQSEFCTAKFALLWPNVPMTPIFNSELSGKMSFAVRGKTQGILINSKILPILY